MAHKRQRDNALYRALADYRCASNDADVLWPKGAVLTPRPWRPGRVPANFGIVTLAEFTPKLRPLRLMAL